MAEADMLRKVRDYALLLLPVAYAVGFLSWSIHQASTGMGFRALSAPHYLVASFPVLAIAGIGTLLRIAFEQGPVHPRPMAWLLDIVSFLFASCLVLSTMEWVGAIHLNTWEFLTTALLVSLLPIMGRITFLIADAIRFLFPSHDEEESRCRLIRPSRAKNNRPHWFNVGVKDVAVPSLTALILLVLVNGHSLLGEIEPAFGGGAPRAAYLDLDPSFVEPTWQTILFPNGTDPDAPVARTVPVEIHHRSSDFILFRTAVEPDRHHRLFDLSTDAVRAIVWCGDSCDRWLPPPAANP